MINSPNNIQNEKIDYNHYKNIIHYWSVIEILSPKNMEKCVKFEDNTHIYNIVGNDAILPWQEGHEHTCETNTSKGSWVYSVFVGQGSFSKSQNALLNKFKNSLYRKPIISKEHFSLFSFAVDAKGFLIKESLTLSSYAWAIGQLKIISDPRELYDKLLKFKKEEKKILDSVNNFIEDNLEIFDEENNELFPIVLTFENMKKLFDYICEELFLEPLKDKMHLKVKASLVQIDSDMEEQNLFDGILNSFFLDDLDRLCDDIDNEHITNLTKIFLAKSNNPSKRSDIRKETSLKHKWLAPEDYPNACWPSVDSLPLVYSQQRAVNCFFKESCGELPLFTVNGPPGTGKTTILRDIIANIISMRANEISAFENPRDVFLKLSLASSSNNQGESAVFGVHPSVCGFEIVVASSNNGAVENVTLEIPGVNAVDPKILNYPDYFQKFANLLLPDTENAWGLIAARLGNRSNKVNFIKKFWLDDILDADKEYKLSKLIMENSKKTNTLGSGFESFLSAQNQNVFGKTNQDRTSTHKLTSQESNFWKKAVDEFNNAQQHALSLMLKKQSIYEKYLQCIKEHTSVDHIVGLPECYIDESQNVDVQELSNVWMDNEWHKARVDVFMAALQLHRTMILLNANHIKKNLKQLMFLLAGDSGLNEVEATAAWQTLFLVIPVISTTFASFSNLFGDLSPEALGWVMIDEAGQSLPQSVMAPLCFSKKVLMIGDPLQLEPVNTVDPVIQQAIAQFADIPYKWIPSNCSSIEIADSVNIYGTYLGNTWVGMPLRVHRRCENPMFKISNKIAYDNLMVYGTLENNKYSVLPPSQWFHVGSAHSVGNWVPEEGEVLVTLVDTLQRDGVDMKDVFLVSPFADVIRHTKTLQKKYGILSSTIHSVQGLENAIVILVLGGRVETNGARLWATRRPNLLNVAITRAKNRLYIIGNKDLWKDMSSIPEILDFID